MILIFLLVFTSVSAKKQSKCVIEFMLCLRYYKFNLHCFRRLPTLLYTFRVQGSFFDV